MPNPSDRLIFVKVQAKDGHFLSLSLLALAEDEKAPSSVVLDEKNFKEKVSGEGD